MNTKTPTYRIGRLIIELGDPPGWTCFLEAEPGRVERLAGVASVDRENNVLWLKAWSVRDEHPNVKTVTEAEAALAGLSLWTGTRWAVQWDDFGHGTLLDCRTGDAADLADPETAQACAKIRRSVIVTAPIKIAIKLNNCATNDPCAICGQRTDPDVGPEFFLADSWALVCHQCTAEKAPELMALYQSKMPSEGMPL